jgi:hypothetical protein
MKKKLEADLISIAHRILQLKNKEDIRVLHLETQKLYEKLSVLLFVEENFGEVKPTIGLHDIEIKLEKIFEAEEDEILIPENEEKDAESITENKIKPIAIISNIMGELTHDSDTVNTMEAESIADEPIIEFEDQAVIDIPRAEKKQTTIDELLESIHVDPIFDKIEKIDKEEKQKEPVVSDEISKILTEKVATEKSNNIAAETKFVDLPKTQDFTFEKVDTTEPQSSIFEKIDAVNLNDKLKKSINITLNDRLAFEKNLFGGSSEDLNRVISQLSTFDSLADAKNFINDMVKPDYNNWRGKEEFAERFMEIVESKFV